MATKDFIVRASEYKNENYSYGKMKDNTFAPLTRFAPMYYRYPGSMNKALLTFSSDVIVVTSYGFPKLWDGEDINISYSKFKIPFDTAQKSCNDLYKMAKEIDEKHINEKEEIFADFIKEYNASAKKKGSKKIKIEDLEYSSIVKSPKKKIYDDDDDDEPTQRDNNEPEKIYPDFFYVKLDRKFNMKKNPETGIDTKEEEITTLFFLKKENNVVEPIQVKTIADIATKIEPVFKWMSSIKLLVSANLWSMKNVKDGKILWGVKLKLRQIRIELAQSSIVKNVQKKISTTYALEDSDDEPEPEPVKDKINKDPKSSHNPNVSALLSDDESDGDENENEEDEEELEETSDNSTSEDNASNDNQQKEQEEQEDEKHPEQEQCEVDSTVEKKKPGRKTKK